MKTNPTIEKLHSVLRAFTSNDVSLTLNIIFECAMDNAGCDGRGNAIEYLSYSEAEQVVFNIRFMVDAKQVTDATPEDYAAAEKLLRDIEA